MKWLTRSDLFDAVIQLAAFAVTVAVLSSILPVEWAMLGGSVALAYAMSERGWGAKIKAFRRYCAEQESFRRYCAEQEHEASAAKLRAAMSFGEQMAEREAEQMLAMKTRRTLSTTPQSTSAAPNPASSKLARRYPTLSEYEAVWDRHLLEGIREVREKRERERNQSSPRT
jgi:hypothetical protein